MLGCALPWRERYKPPGGAVCRWQYTSTFVPQSATLDIVKTIEQFVFGNIFYRLPVYRMERPPIERFVSGYGECLFLPRFTVPPKFHMATFLRDARKTERFKDGNHVFG